MEPKYLAFRRWLYTPIIIWQGDWIPRDSYSLKRIDMKLTAVLGTKKPWTRSMRSRILGWLKYSALARYECIETTLDKQKRGGGRAPVQFPYKTLFSRKSTKSFNVKNKSSHNHKAILYNSSTFRQWCIALLKEVFLPTKMEGVFLTN